MVWKVKKLNKYYLVHAENEGSFLFNNKYDAERLCIKLNAHENDRWMGKQFKEFLNKLNDDEERII